MIIPCYNARQYICEALASAVAQEYVHEVILVDDCSTDDSVACVQAWLNVHAAQTADISIRVLQNAENSGVAVSRNRGVQEADGKYIAFLDSDDTWISNKLETQIKFMKKNNIAFSFSNYSVMKEDGTPTGNIIHAPKVIGYHGYLRNTIIGCLTVIIDKEKTGSFMMPNIKSSHDMALWLLIMKRGFKAYGLQKTLANYRLVSTSNTAKKWKAAKDVWKVYREIEHINPIYSTICFVGYAINAIIKRL